MPKIQYEDKNLRPKALRIIEQANEIIATYTAQGYDLTLRQLYYQFVSRDLIPNKQSEYKKLGGVISDGRRAGLIDWLAIVDRTRNLRGLSHWDNPGDYIMPDGYTVDKWESQPHRVEVWIEKDALAGVFQRVCNELDVPYFSCRGYTSDSEIWAAAQRLKRYERNGQAPIILHFGDHDPSGIDMTRDIRERIELLGGPELDVRRLALNMDQVQEYDPPPNPAKDVDPRFKGYIAKYGDESWELDALEPSVLAELVRGEIEGLLDQDAWEEKEREEQEGRDKLHEVADRLREEE
jgi:hypothetical protein